MKMNPDQDIIDFTLDEDQPGTSADADRRDAFRREQEKREQEILQITPPPRMTPKQRKQSAKQKDAERKRLKRQSQSMFQIIFYLFNLFF